MCMYVCMYVCIYIYIYVYCISIIHMCVYICQTVCTSADPRWGTTSWSRPLEPEVHRNLLPWPTGKGRTTDCWPFEIHLGRGAGGPRFYCCPLHAEQIQDIFQQCFWFEQLSPNFLRLHPSKCFVWVTKQSKDPFDTQLAVIFVGPWRTAVMKTRVSYTPIGAEKQLTDPSFSAAHVQDADQSAMACDPPHWLPPSKSKFWVSAAGWSLLLSSSASMVSLHWQPSEVSLPGDALVFWNAVTFEPVAHKNTPVFFSNVLQKPFFNRFPDRHHLKAIWHQVRLCVQESIQTCCTYWIWQSTLIFMHLLSCTGPKIRASLKGDRGTSGFWRFGTGICNGAPTTETRIENSCRNSFCFWGLY